MLKAVILALSLVCAINGDFWTPCDDVPTAVAPRQIISPACTPGATHCVATRGQILEADAYITLHEAHNYLRVNVTAFVFGIGVNLPAVDDDACNGMYDVNRVFQGCPTVPNQEHIWQINVLVSEGFPAFQNSRVRFELIEGGEIRACADVMANLV